jgi:hypothetical protein
LNAFGGVQTATSLAREGVLHNPVLLHLNECPYPPSPRVIEAVSHAVAAVNRYGDPRPGALAAMIAALAVAWWAATSRRSRPAGPDSLRAALGCETLAALADAGVLPEEAAAVADAFGIGSAASTPPLIPWATGLDLGGVPRGEALRQAGKVARARGVQRDGDARQFGRIVVALVIAGLAVLAYALVLFLPAIDFFMAISEASASR